MVFYDPPPSPFVVFLVSKFRHFLPPPPPFPFEETSFMDDPKFWDALLKQCQENEWDRALSAMLYA